MMLALALASCGGHHEARDSVGGEAESIASTSALAPRRIVSLDLCADQYVLQFAKRSQILALSPDANKPFSALRARTTDIPQVLPRMENVLALAPDLVVRSYGGGPGAERMLSRAGVPVVQLAFPETMAAVRSEIVRVGSALGDPQGAEAIAAQMDAGLAASRARAASMQGGKAPKRALYMSAAGVSAGPGTLMDEALRAAGLANYQSTPGWQALPLEQMVLDPPDLIAEASFTGAGGNLDRWSAARHSLLRDQIKQSESVAVDGALVACGAWPIADAVAELSRGANGSASKPKSGQGDGH